MTIKRPETGWPMERVTTHPGEVLLEDFLKPMKISANHLATQTRMPATRIGSIVHGRRSITTETALRLARFFGTSAEMWINLQAAYDLSKARIEMQKRIDQEVQLLSLAV